MPAAADPLPALPECTMEAPRPTIKASPSTPSHQHILQGVRGLPLNAPQANVGLLVQEPSPSRDDGARIEGAHRRCQVPRHILW